MTSCIIQLIISRAIGTQSKLIPAISFVIGPIASKIPSNVADIPTKKLDFSSSADMLDNSC